MSEENQMGGSATGRDSGPYRDGSKKFVKAVFCMTDGKEFIYSKRDISNDYGNGYNSFMTDCGGTLERRKTIRLRSNDIIVMTDHVKYVRFEISNE